MPAMHATVRCVELPGAVNAIAILGIVPNGHRPVARARTLLALPCAPDQELACDRRIALRSPSGAGGLYRADAGRRAGTFSLAHPRHLDDRRACGVRRTRVVRHLSRSVRRPG